MKNISRISMILLFVLLLAGCTETPELTTENPPVIPMPAEVDYLDGSLDLKGCRIRKEERTEKFARLLARGIREAAGTRLKMSGDGNIQLLLHKDSEIPEEGYQLQVADQGIRLEASGEAGLFYGIQTLVQMAEKDGTIRKCKMNDYPSFRYRGLHLDVSRHYMSTDYIKELLELMSQYKLNRFHWHLVDGGGWRFESDSYPLLTRFGQARTKCDWIEWWKKGDRLFVETGTPGSYGGFYTKEDMKEIVSYAADRYITVIPEIELPGHSNEVFYAYPELTCFQQLGDWEFCIGNPEVFKFLYSIIDEFIEIFPCEYIHIGGDEARKDNWKKCPKCQELMKREGLEKVEELQSWCISTVEKYINSKGKKIIGWDEILQGGLAPNATVMSWRGEEGGITAAQMGHDVIMTPGRPLYLDHFQGNPMTEPLAIGGYNPLVDIYQYNPRPARLDSLEQRHILGVQANLWTEYVNDESHAEYMTWPRALALAEIAWTPAGNKNYEDFLQRANIHTRRMIRNGINAYPLKQVIIRSDVDTLRKQAVVKLEKENLLAEIHYTTDGSRPGPKSPVYTGPITVKDSASFLTAPFIGRKMLSEPCAFSVDYHKAIGKKVKYNCIYSSAYPAREDTTLTDGLRGSWTYKDKRWQGFLSPIDVTIDLGSVQPIEAVKAQFFQTVNSAVWAPEEVEILVSQDGEKFESVGLKTTSLDPEILGTFFEDFKFNLRTEARYVRMKAKRSQKGGFLFLDEIRIF